MFFVTLINLRFVIYTFTQ